MRQNHRAPLLSLLGLARRAGKLSLGNDAAVDELVAMLQKLMK